MPKKKEDFTNGVSLKDSLLDFKETEELIATQSEIVNISLDNVVLPPKQARRYFDETKLKTLADNIKKVGLLQFPVIRKRSDGKFDLIAGERRVRAGKIAELSTITCRIIECDDKTAKEIQLVENLKREDLNAWEETRAIMDLLCTELDIEEKVVKQLLSRMNNEQSGRASKLTRIQNEDNSNHNVMLTERINTIKALFDSMGLMTWESYVKNRLPLLNLYEDVTENLATGKIEYTKAKVINKIKDDAKRIEILNEAVTQKLSLEQIKAIIPKPIIQTNESEFKQAKKRVANIGKKINAKLWKDTDKALELDSLISKLEKLLEDSENSEKE